MPISKEIEDIAAALERNATDQHINLSAKRFGAEGAQQVAAALEKNATVQSINLGRNLFGDKGAERMAAALEKNSTLQRINLQGINFQSIHLQSMMYLSDKKYKIGDDKIGDKGAERLAAALEKNATLQSINLKYNKIGDKGTERLVAAFAKNGTLQEITLDGNNMDPRFGKRIEMLKQSPDLLVCMHSGEGFDAWNHKELHAEIHILSLREKSPCATLAIVETKPEECKSGMCTWKCPAVVQSLWQKLQDEGKFWEKQIEQIRFEIRVQEGANLVAKGEVDQDVSKYRRRGRPSMEQLSCTLQRSFWSLQSVASQGRVFFSCARGAWAEASVSANELQELYDVVARFKATRSLSTTRCGSGNSIEKAEHDMRSVKEVTWFLLAMPGIAGELGIVHSVLQIDVQDSSTYHSYALEKAMVSAEATEAERKRLRNGIYVSDFCTISLEVQNQLQKYHALATPEVRAAQTMGDLLKIAFETGAYDIRKSNCHHFARTAFNACARDDAKVDRMPNEGYMEIANFLPHFGLGALFGAGVAGSVASGATAQPAASASVSASLTAAPVPTALAGTALVAAAASSLVGHSSETSQDVRELLAENETVQAILQEVPIAKQLVAIAQTIYSKHSDRKKIEPVTQEIIETTLIIAKRIPCLSEKSEQDQLKAWLQKVHDDLNSIGRTDRWLFPEQALPKLQQALLDLHRYATLLSLMIKNDVEMKQKAMTDSEKDEFVHHLEESKGVRNCDDLVGVEVDLGASPSADTQFGLGSASAHSGSQTVVPVVVASVNDSSYLGKTQRAAKWAAKGLAVAAAAGQAANGGAGAVMVVPH